MIALQNVSFSYGKRAVFQDLDLAFEPGKFHAVLGANGCGKSTLLKLVTGELVPQSGRVSPVYADAFKRARALAVVTQEIPERIPLTVRETVSLGFYAAGKPDSRKLEDVLISLSIADLQKRMYGTLSGGQKQRVWLARALVQDTPFLLLDEPAGSLDAGFRQKLYRFLKEYAAGGRTVVMATHDLHLAPGYADNAILLKAGRVLASGTPQNILTPELLREAFDLEEALP